MSLVIRMLQEDQSSTRVLLEQLCSKMNAIEGRANWKDMTGDQWCAIHKVKPDIATCSKFKSLTASYRYGIVKSNNFCFVCLGRNHPFIGALIRHICKTRLEGVMCGKSHHTLLLDHFVQSLGLTSISVFSFSSKSTVLLETYYRSVMILPLAFSGIQGLRVP